MRLAGLEGQRHVAAIVEGLFEGLAQVVFVGQRGNPAFQIFMLRAGSQFQSLDLLAGILQHFSCHALVSSRAVSTCSIWIRDAGACEGASCKSFSAASSR